MTVCATSRPGESPNKRTVAEYSLPKEMPATYRNWDSLAVCWLQISSPDSFRPHEVPHKGARHHRAWRDPCHCLLLSLGRLFYSKGAYEQRTHISSWKSGLVHGFMKDGREVQIFDTLKQILASNFDLVEAVDLSLLSHCTDRMYQWSVDHVTVWKRKPQRP